MALCKEGLKECETGFESISAGRTLPINIAQSRKGHSHRMLSEQRTTGISKPLLYLASILLGCCQIVSTEGDFAYSE